MCVSEKTFERVRASEQMSERKRGREREGEVGGGGGGEKDHARGEERVHTSV